MKVERLTHGSPDCPLVRLFDFTPSEAETLRQAVRRLADRQRMRVDLEADCGVSPVEGFALAFVAAPRDVGFTPEPSHSCWVLRPESWDNIEGLIVPFTQGATGYQWLCEVGDTALLFSPDGSW